MNANAATHREDRATGPEAVGRLALKALLAMQIFIGYEWFSSGLTKVVDGGFASGLAEELRADADALSGGLYKSFLTGTVIPNAKVFGVLIEVGELAIGIALIVAAIVWLARWSRLPEWGRTVVLGTTAVAALGGIFMAINFHLASGASHPWLIPKSGFDESVDLDSLLPMLQLVLVAFTGRLLYVGYKNRRANRRSMVTDDAKPDPVDHTPAAVSPS